MHLWLKKMRPSLQFPFLSTFRNAVDVSLRPIYVKSCLDAEGGRERGKESKGKEGTERERGDRFCCLALPPSSSASGVRTPVRLVWSRIAMGVGFVLGGAGGRFRKYKRVGNDTTL